MPENVKNRPRHAYLPFGAGRRMCVGSTFAIVEATLLAAMISRRMTFDIPRGVTVEPEAAITLRPKNGLPMTVHRRSVGRARPGTMAVGDRVDPVDAAGECPVAH